MEQEKPRAISERFSIVDPSQYFIYGFIWKNAKCEALLNGKKLPVKTESWKAEGYSREQDAFKNESREPVQLKITMPEKLPDAGKLDVYLLYKNKRYKWFSNSAKALLKKDKELQIMLDRVVRTGYTGISVSGWIACEDAFDIEAKDEQGKQVPFRKNTFSRPDVQKMFSEAVLDKECGFQLVFENISADAVFLTFRAGNHSKTIRFAMKKSEVVREKVTGYAVKGASYLRRNGLKAFAVKVVQHMGKKDRPIRYSDWIKHNFATESQLAEQRKTHFAYEPLISIVVPLYKTKEKFLKDLVDSVRAQSYSNWELCLSDGSGTPSPIAKQLEAYAVKDKRIKIIPAGGQYRIVENTNRAIEKATGEFIAFADHDDVLAPDALFECVKAMNEQDYDLLYTDEDKTDMPGQTYFEPQMKPDFNLDLLRTVNYICHLTVIRRTLLDEIGYLDPAYEGAQDYDLVLRAVEHTKKIGHVPKVLYHWRSHMDSTAENPESKRYAFDAGRRAIQAHFDRLGIAAEVTDGEWPGLYRTRYIRSYDPLISILIPNKDHIDDLDRCIKSIDEHSTYTNYEYIIVENNSDQEETFEYYKKLEAENPKAHVVYYEGNFNYSLINNFGAKYAKGEYILLLNNDISMINPDCLEEMLGYCMRPDVGIVGARLYYEDDTIQHAGVVVGFGGIAGHCFVQQPRSSTGYCHRIICAQDYSAVTAACMMVDRKAFDEVNGLSDDLAVAFNDIDFCLRIREAGYLVVYNPYAELYHYESKSRGLEDTPEKVARFNREIETFEKKWGDFLEKGDPYYSPNLTLDSQDFSLRKNY